MLNERFPGAKEATCIAFEQIDNKEDEKLIINDQSISAKEAIGI